MPERDTVTLNRRSERRSRAAIVLLLFVLFLAPACGQEAPAGGNEAASDPGAKVSEERRERIEAAAQGETDPQEATDAQDAEAESGTLQGTNTAAQQAPEAPVVHRASEENSRGDYTYLSQPDLDGNPNAAVFATPEGDYDHNIGVWYEPEKQQWAIFNQDRAPVEAGSTFEVVVPPESERFVHRSSEDNVSAETTYLDDPLVNGKPDAPVSVTQNWNPGGGEGVYNDRPIGVRYDPERERWAVYNGDRSEMPVGAAFNVTVSEQARTTALGSGADVSGEEISGVGSDADEVPEYRDFFKEEGNPQTPENLVSSDSSTGAIPVVRPFNFGRDPGGPEDKTLYLTIPKIGVEGVPAFDTVSEEKLRDGTVHIPATGYPWQRGANVFIAGHRIGYENTPSYYIFFRLDRLTEGDEIRLEDANGRQFVYRVSKTTVVGPDSVEVMNAVEGKSLITLQTCTLPDYEDRLIVQGELVERTAGA